jgi:hypothetical protein
MSFRPAKMLPPRLELGSRTNLVLPAYKAGALPIELQEQTTSINGAPVRTRTALPGLRNQCFANLSFGRAERGWQESNLHGLL